MTFELTIKPFGTSAILIEWPHRVDAEILEDIVTFKSYLEENYLSKSMYECVSSYNSLTIISKESIEDFLSSKRSILKWYVESSSRSTKSTPTRSWDIPVCYDAEYAIDMMEVRQKTGLSVEEIIEIHTNTVYKIYAIGFLPGFMYLGGLDTQLHVPRKETPRLRVSKGAVGLAGKQTGIYPQDSPGGWQIIGSCPVPLFDAGKTDPCFYSVGDEIRFFQISAEAYADYLQKIVNHA